MKERGVSVVASDRIGYRGRERGQDVERGDTCIVCAIQIPGKPASETSVRERESELVAYGKTIDRFVGRMRKARRKSRVEPEVSIDEFAG